MICDAYEQNCRLQWALRIYLGQNNMLSEQCHWLRSVRAMAKHPIEYAFASGGADNIKKFRLPRGEFLHNMLQNQGTIVESMALNEDGVLVSGGNNGSMW